MTTNTVLTAASAEVDRHCPVRFSSFPTAAGQVTLVAMRAIRMVLAIIGGCSLAGAVVIEAAKGNLAGVGWVLIGPAPFYAAGLVGAFRRPGNRVAAWLLATGALFMLNVCLSDAIGDLPAVAESGSAWAVMFIADLATNASVVTAIGLIGLYPSGVPRRRHERVVLGTATLMAALLPVLLLLSSATPPESLFQPAEPSIVSPLFRSGFRPAEPLVAAVRYTFTAWTVVGVILLYLRYRRSAAEDRRRIRWLLAGMGSATLVFAALSAVWLSGASGAAATASIFLLWALAVVLALGSLVIPLSQDGVFGIDRSVRRSMVYRALWLIIAAVYIAAAVTLGLLASRFLPAGAAVVLATAAALLFQPTQGRLERLADRWVFGARLDGYDVLSRFGTMLENSPGAADLLPRLAVAIRDGLALDWARVRVDLMLPGGGLPSVGAAGIEPDDLAEPALVVPLVHAGTTLGRIECGPRRDGLVPEDRRLLTSLAGQAATAARNVHLTAQLSDRLETIRRQAAELTASRARVAQAQDAERQRIQRDLHDGVQQDLVVLAAKLALARERLRRGDPRADEPHAELQRDMGDLLAELQRDMGDLLAHLREIAHAIHPPVLADQGLLEAIEAQAARMPVEVVIEADPALRGVRYPPQIEAATWFVVSETLTNAVKHARAGRVLVALAQPNGYLAVEVSDDGRGFDKAAVHGRGLAGLADRVSIVNGTLRIDSKPGQGTTLRAEIPLARADAGDA
jgi:signal transduction histidine kinase